MIRVAAVGDIHLGVDSRGTARPAYAGVAHDADVLLVAGDLTRLGTVDEAKVVADELGDLGLPTIAVLGNHDFQSDAADEITDVLCSAGITVLDGTSTTLMVGERSLGLAGVKGFGGGFVGASASDFGERAMKAFVRAGESEAEALAASLGQLAGADVRIALTHYAPTETTLEGEPVALRPFLGAYQLGEAIDNGNVALALHGHAHRGNEVGSTPGGVHVRNVAYPVINAAYRVYCVDDGGLGK